MTSQPDSSHAYLLQRCDAVRQRVRDAVDTRRAAGSDADDRFRGLYVSDEQALQLFDDRPSSGSHPLLDAELESWAAAKETSGETIRLRSMGRAFGLDALEIEVLLVALCPDLDPRLEKAYGYLHDDVTRRRASTGLALELCARDPHEPSARNLVSPSGTLIRNGLIVVEEQERPFLTRSLRVPDAVTSFLLGDDSIEQTIAPLLTVATAPCEGFDVTTVERALKAGVRLFYVREHVGTAARAFVQSAAAATGTPLLILDFERVRQGDDLAVIATCAIRHARMSGSILCIGPLDSLGERAATTARAFTESDAVVIVTGRESWDPRWSTSVPLVLEAPEIRDPTFEGLPFRLTPEQAARARSAASITALARGTAVDAEHLASGARAQNAGGLERLALRIEPNVTWADLVVPWSVTSQLDEVCERVRHRDRVLDEWGLRRGPARGRGVSVLHAGDSGTGKTLAAEVVANALGLDLYVVDLSTVVDKYIGETEKNLDRIFREADRVNGVLLFDEADALFGKRSEVQDARDRYANVEVAYLLQRMERFDGVAILTTNLRANIDDAFLRRIDVLVDFPTPDREMRRLLWERHLPSAVPRDETVDIDFLARQFDLAGGNIRNITLAAAFDTARSGQPLSMRALVTATAREYRKLGRLCVPSEFGEHYELIQAGPS